MNGSDYKYMTGQDGFAADAVAEERARFITRTYFHLAGAIAAFIVLTGLLLNMPFTQSLVESMIGGQYSWLIVMGAFMAVSWIANSWAMSTTSLGTQYMGLSLYVIAQAVIMVPILFIAQRFYPDVIPAAGATTLGLFAVLTAVVFITRSDFSFMRSALMFLGFAAMGLIVCAILFKFELGPIFTYAMIAFACAYILYDTSNVMLHYRTDQYVAASLALFASVALLFWWVLRLFMNRD